MKKIATYLLFFICLYSFGQTKGDIAIKWTPKSPLNIGDQKLMVPQFDPNHFQYDSSTKRIYFVFQTPIASEINEKSLQISNIVYEEMTESDLGDLALSSIPNSPTATAQNLKSKNDLYVSILLSPIVKIGNAVKKSRLFLII